MGRWNHKYNKNQIGAGTTITNHQPGAKIADAVTEIQNRVPNEVKVDPSCLVEVTLGNNVLRVDGGIKGVDVIQNPGITTIDLKFNAKTNRLELEVGDLGITTVTTNYTAQKETLDATVTNATELCLEYGDFVPSGGSSHLFLTRDGNGTLIWDYVRAI